MLSKEQILNADDLAKELVSVPEWNGEIYVRKMTGTERDRYEMLLDGLLDPATAGNVTNIRSTLCALTICDESGALLFDEKEIEALGKKSAVALDRVRKAAEKLNFSQKKD